MGFDGCAGGAEGRGPEGNEGRVGCGGEEEEGMQVGWGADGVVDSILVGSGVWVEEGEGPGASRGEEGRFEKVGGTESKWTDHYFIFLMCPIRDCSACGLWVAQSRG